MSNSVSKIGLQGIIKGFNLASQDAAKLTQAFIGESKINPIEPIVNLKRDTNLVKASSKIVQVGVELDREILDILA